LAPRCPGPADLGGPADPVESQPLAEAPSKESNAASPEASGDGAVEPPDGALRETVDACARRRRDEWGQDKRGRRKFYVFGSETFGYPRLAYLFFPKVPGRTFLPNLSNIVLLQQPHR
jgi:hypothetical protein